MLTFESHAERRLLELVRHEFGLGNTPIDTSTPLSKFAADSLDWVELISAVEDEYGLQISPAQCHQLVTIGDLLKLLGHQGG